MKVKPNLLFFGVVVILFGALIICGISIIDSPTTVRQKKLDDARTRNLAHISRQVLQYYRDNSNLPERLSEIVPGNSNWFSLYDPETNDPYEYEIVDKLSFRLCGNFTRARQLTGKSIIYYLPEETHIDWSHIAGKHCFLIPVKS